ncbi:hypothetical protein BCV70DRAFT_214584 [Testicularia cyperi]|uniref:Uncharacterized protein n=1 Tax=Testicularia cyperi TaxID=1882483 RepID=A0A317XXW8_9BASI|nr:hypothetical protein BCV70DRAFT_214584 [Testicularia cyperi]
MSGQFRLHPEPGEHKNAQFKLGRSAFETIRRGGVGALLLVPHLLLPIYGIYVVINRFEFWNNKLEDYVGVLVALIEGLSFGAIVGLAMLRYGTAGKAIKGRRIEKTATDEEDLKQARVEVALRSAVYVFFAALLWEYLVQSKYSPLADEYARKTSSGLMTASSGVRKFFNNESLLPNTVEGRNQMAGVGLNWDIKDRIQNAPRVTVPGFKKVPQKSAFLRAWEWTWNKVTSGPRPGLFEIGPRNWH